MTENLASNVESISTSIEEIARSVAKCCTECGIHRFCRLRRPPQTRASNGSSLRSVASVSKRAEDVTKQVGAGSGRRRDCGQEIDSRARSRVRSSMEQSAGVIREMGNAPKKSGASSTRSTSLLSVQICCR